MNLPSTFSPFQKNHFLIISNLFQTSFEDLNIEKKTRIEVMAELRRISLPPLDKNLLLQFSSLAKIFLNRMAQSLFFSFPLLRGRPKYLIGKVVMGMCRMEAIVSLSWAAIPKQTKDDFTPFNQRPEISPKMLTIVYKIFASSLPLPQRKPCCQRTA
jgi:hypothetical protein